MTSSNPWSRWTGALPMLPTSVRVLLTAFLAIIGSGYLVAALNISSSHQHADGRPGMSMDDVRAIYSGMQVQAAGETVPSRMLTMLRGPMRQYASSDAHFNVLESWLKDGGAEVKLDDGDKRVTPRRVLLLDCMRCHAQSTGSEVSKQSPFGPDDFTLDYSMLSRYLATAASNDGELVRTAPQYTLERLILVSHQHMLSIPMFTLVVGLLFCMTRLPASWRGLLAPLPMLALLLDLSGWWLARVAEPFVYAIVIGGGVFGLAFGVQIVVVVIDLWRPPGAPSR